MTYYLDANVFIEAHRSYYNSGFCPAFWDWLIESHGAGKVFSIEMVAHELARGDDELKEWTAERGKKFFVPLEARAMPDLERVQRWAKEKDRYTTTAINKFRVYTISCGIR